MIDPTFAAHGPPGFRRCPVSPRGPAGHLGHLDTPKTLPKSPAVRCPKGPDTGVGGVRRWLVPMLLHGGCGYEDV